MSINKVKGYYQFCKIKYSLLRSYLSWNNLFWNASLKSRLEDRGYKYYPAKQTRVFLILSINNWEEKLVKAFNFLFPTYHFSWDKVENFFPNENMWRRFYDDLNNKLTEEFNKFYQENSNCNIIVFVYASDFSIKSDVLKRIKRKNVFIVSFCWDDLLYFSGKAKGQPVGIKNLSRVVDLNLTFSPEAIPHYRRNKSICYFWEYSQIYSMNKKQFMYTDILIEENKSFYVLFVGTCYGYRKDLIERIKKAGIPVKCYGQGWKDSHALSYEMLTLEVAKAPVTLGVSFVGYTKSITTLKGRDFEIPLWGGCYLTQRSKGIEFYYEEGKDIMLYDSFEDCVEKVFTLKNDSSLRNRLRNNAYKKAQVVANWESKIMNIVDKLEYIASDFKI